MKKTNGDSTILGREENDIGDGNLEVEKTEELLTLAEMQKQEPSSLKSFLEENPEILVSEINRILSWISATDNWFVALSPIMAQDGNILIRITVAPPKEYKLVVYEDKTDNSKQILIEPSN